MSGTIQLTPAELQAQAQELRNLEKEYSALFDETLSELNSVNKNWSANLEHNFTGKITAVQKSFAQITQMLIDGANAADTCAVTFDTLDSQLAKMNYSNAEPNSQNIIYEDIQSIDDVMQWIDDYYSTLPKPVQKILKDTCKKWFGSGYYAYEIVQKMREGDVFGVIAKEIKALAPSVIGEKGDLNFKGLKMKAVSKAIELVTDSDGYIQRNQSKFDDMIFDALSRGDIAGTIWDMGGSFIQTVGKGTVDVSCQLVSDVIDSMFEKTIGISWSTINEIMYEDFGFSPGHAFNAFGKFVSDGVDAALDTGAEFWQFFSKEVYSDLNDFAQLTGGIVHSTGQFIGNVFDGLKNFSFSW